MIIVSPSNTVTSSAHRQPASTARSAAAIPQRGHPERQISSGRPPGGSGRTRFLAFRTTAARRGLGLLSEWWLRGAWSEFRCLDETVMGGWELGDRAAASCRKGEGVSPFFKQAPCTRGTGWDRRCRFNACSMTAWCWGRWLLNQPSYPSLHSRTRVLPEDWKADHSRVIRVARPVCSCIV